MSAVQGITIISDIANACFQAFYVVYKSPGGVGIDQNKDRPYVRLSSGNPDTFAYIERPTCCAGSTSTFATSI